MIHGWHWRWAAVLAGVGLAFLLRQLIVYRFPGIGPFITFYPAVLLAALLDGIWAGIAATALSALLADYWIFPPVGHFALSSPSDAINLLVFSVFGICLSAIIERHHRNREKLAVLRQEAAVAEERRKFEEDREKAILAQNERKRLFAILETLPVMTCLLTPDHKVAFANRMFRERFGEANGRPCYEFCFGQASPCEFCESFVPLKTGEAHRWEVHGPDGSIIDASDLPFTDFDGSRLILEMDVDVTEQRRAENELRAYREHLERMVEERTRQLEETTRRFQTIVDNAPIAIYVKNRDGRFVFGNRRMEQYTGQPLERLLGMTDYDFASKEDADRWRENDLRVLKGQRAEFEETGTDRNGRPYINLSIKFPLSSETGTPAEICGISTDITGRKRAEEELKKLNRILKALSRSNQAILHAIDEQEFLHEVCKIVTEDCGHAMVWIGFAERDEKQSVRIVAHAGFEAGYLDSLQLTWGEGELGQGPTGRSIRSGKPAICHDMLTDPAYAPWREEAVKRGYASSISIPFKLDVHNLGAITIYARERNAFSVAEVELLTELAGDVEFGVQTLRMRAAHDRAEKELIRSREMLGVFIEDAPVAMAMFDREMRYLHVSRRWKSDYGLEDRALTGLSHYEVFPEIPAAWKRAHRQGLAGKSLRSDEDLFDRADGSQQWIRWEIRPWYETDGSVGGILILTEDITDRKKAEAALIESERLTLQRGQLRALTERLEKAREEERRCVARDLHDDIGQILTAVKMDLMWIGKHATDQNSGVQHRLEGAVGLINEGVRSLRKICTGLRPAVLDDLGLAAAIEWQANEFSSRTGIVCRLSLPAGRLGLSRDHATAFFRIFQECLTNISRHAHARTVGVSLHKEGENVVLVVKDDGKGFSDNSLAPSLGVLGMKERAQVCGGELLIDSSAGKGTSVTIRVPLRLARAKEDDDAHSDR